MGWNDKIDVTTGFQFHLVRLKGTRPYTRFSNQNVSIPFGAIKSLESSQSVGVIFVFQFHLVRLKVKSQFDRHHHLLRFNSIWCD